MTPEQVYCPRCGLVHDWKMDYTNKRGECLSCGRTACGKELAALRARGDGSEGRNNGNGNRR